eukprot:SAG22_NODE_756_length_7442_cov_2.044668_1_plen_1614_part_00
MPAWAFIPENPRYVVRNPLGGDGPPAAADTSDTGEMSPRSPGWKAPASLLTGAVATAINAPFDAANLAYRKAVPAVARDLAGEESIMSHHLTGNTSEPQLANSSNGDEQQRLRSLEYKNQIGHAAEERQTAEALEAAAKIAQANAERFKDLHGRSCCCLGQHNGLRASVHALVTAKWFDYFMLGVTLVTIFTLTVEHPGAGLAPLVKVAVKVAEFAAELLFLVEVVLKSVAQGLIGNKYTYLERPSLNVLDFLIVCTMYSTHLFSAQNGDSNGPPIFVVALRGLRPIRAVRLLPFFNPYLAQVMKSLSQSRMDLFMVIFLILVIFIVLGTLSVQLFAGALSRQCVAAPEHIAQNLSLVDDNITRLDNITRTAVHEYMMESACPPAMQGKCLAPMRCAPIVLPSWLEEQREREDAIDLYGFDNVVQAVGTMFVVMSLDEWPLIYRPLARSIGDDTGIIWLFFASMVILLALLCANLFIAVITSAFDRVKGMSAAEFRADEGPDDGPGSLGSVDTEGLDKSERAVRIEKEDEKEKLGATTVPSDRQRHRLEAAFDEVAAAQAGKGEIQTEEMITDIVRNMAEDAESNVYEGPILLAELQKFVDDLDTDEDGFLAIAPGDYVQWLSTQVSSADGRSSDTALGLQKLHDWIKVDEPDWGDASYKPFPFVPGLTPVLRKVVVTEAFEMSCLAVVFLNGLFMATYHHPMDQRMADGLAVVELFFVGLYLLEIVLKVAGLGWRNYWGIKFNPLDFFISMLSAIAMVYHAVAPDGVELDASAVSSFRCVRIVLKLSRLLRLARAASWSADLNDLLGKIQDSWRAVVTVFTFVAMVMVLLSVLSMHLLGVCYGPDFADSIERVGRSNFHTFYDAFLANFQMLSGEDWVPIMFNHVYECAAKEMYTKGTVFVFFVVAYVVYCFVLYNLFTAVILSDFSLSEEEKMLKQKWQYFTRLTKQQRDEEKKADAAVERGVITKDTHSMAKEDVDAEPEAEAGGDGTEAGKKKLSDVGKQPSRDEAKLDAALQDVEATCFCLKEDNGFRKLCVECADSPTFERVIFSCIVVGAVVLALEGPPPAQTEVVYNGGVNLMAAAKNGTLFGAVVPGGVDGPDADTDWLNVATPVFAVLNFVFFAIFFAEMVIKMVAFGFSVYFKDYWNRIDFVIVFFSTIDMAFSMMDEPPMHLGFVRAIRLARILRALKLIQHHAGLKIIVSVLVDCIPTVISTFKIAAFLFILFAITGLHLFCGKFFFCDTGDEADKYKFGLDDCIESGGVWRNPPYNFDNIFDAWKSLFVCSTTEGWVEIMQAAMDAPHKVGEPLLKNNNKYMAAAYFLLFMVLGSFYMTNLFIGVLVSYFGQSSGSGILTAEQKRWMYSKLLTLLAGHDVAPIPDKNSWRHGVYRVMKWKHFDNTLVLAIMFNVVLMASESYPQTPEGQHLYWWGYFVCTIIFTLEALVKVFGTSFTRYIASNWNKLDLAIVVGAWASLLMELAEKRMPGTGGMRALRVLRILSSLRVITSLETLATMLSTLILSLPSILNLAALEGLVFFVFGVLGMHLFGVPPESVPPPGVYGADGAVIGPEENFDGEATVLSFKGSDHCLSFCFSAFSCGSTALTSDRCNQTSGAP